MGSADHLARNRYPGRLWYCGNSGCAAAEGGRALDRRRTGPTRETAAAGVYDSNSAIVGAAVEEAGGEPVHYGVLPDDEAKLEAAVRQALAACDMVVLSGGTS